MDWPELPDLNLECQWLDPLSIHGVLRCEGVLLLCVGGLLLGNVRISSHVRKIRHQAPHVWPGCNCNRLWVIIRCLWFSW